ncbi:hypothetical protein FISHEDRAFT_71112 [Fistulina hepatica ATCC 64428]|nr:hypothetical protein FISHEDRAFT_71112 [Fistulina hepatica ATCC 64428]
MATANIAMPISLEGTLEWKMWYCFLCDKTFMTRLTFQVFTLTARNASAVLSTGILWATSIYHFQPFGLIDDQSLNYCRACRKHFRTAAGLQYTSREHNEVDIPEGGGDTYSTYEVEEARILESGKLATEEAPLHHLHENAVQFSRYSYLLSQSSEAWYASSDDGNLGPSSKSCKHREEVS